MSTQLKELSVKSISSLLEYLNNIEHLKLKNITYFNHALQSLYLSKKLMLASVCLFVHSIFPNLFITVGSDTITQLYHKLNKEEKKLS
jgi:hypothetical protein